MVSRSNGSTTAREVGCASLGIACGMVRSNDMSCSAVAFLGRDGMRKDGIRIVYSGTVYRLPLPANPFLAESEWPRRKGTDRKRTPQKSAGLPLAQERRKTCVAGEKVVQRLQLPKI